ncbi:type II toxin-antitoxin system YafO family toxin [Marinomonas aquiplantarum]|uniref:Type II toxin-antitoxin system toxin YafO n=1 Tax=Marinomonas aquiplantarum TaxID=491951 RepID=A0A366CYG0_9GAMM|nr:type II toxin-antitoxin system YafO family toxin [Marinomonas aquiplantarum]RBO82665.1 type II toxin-antitoxin system toxin YafO [Marinomonas aquiplantarum]
MPIVQTTSLFRLADNWELHKNSFESYKLYGRLPDYFGRDAELSHPTVYHIHLAVTEKLAKEWSKRYPRIDQVRYRTTKAGDPENDYWLIYAYDDLDDKYLLLTIIGPDAHNDAEWRASLTTLYIQFVEPWINGKLDDVI